MSQEQQNECHNTLTQEIKSLALQLGFHRVGITSASPVSSSGSHFLQWLSDGFSAEMAYLKKSPEIRFDPKRRFPEARSVISLALNYYQKNPDRAKASTPEDQNPEPPNGKVARYAWGEDYHHIIEEKLTKLIQEITVRGGRCWKGYVDHGLLLERAFAERAGIGFIGKNTNLITPDFGSWVFLAEVITDLRLSEDSPAPSQCGSCRRCIDACPTGALREAYRLDARRCISYLTIENKGPIPEALIPKMDGWIFGCDVCQEVCPFNGNVIPSDAPGLASERGAGPSLSIREISEIPDNASFKKRFKRTPLLRAKLSGMARNADALCQSMEKED